MSTDNRPAPPPGDGGDPAEPRQSREELLASAITAARATFRAAGMTTLDDDQAGEPLAAAVETALRVARAHYAPEVVNARHAMECVASRRAGRADGREQAAQAVATLHREFQGRCVECVEWCECADRDGCTHGNVSWPCPTIMAARGAGTSPAPAVLPVAAELAAPAPTEPHRSDVKRLVPLETQHITSECRSTWGDIAAWSGATDSLRQVYELQADRWPGATISLALYVSNPDAPRPGFGRRNPHCSNCGDERGGPFRHKISECRYRPGMTAAELAATMPADQRGPYWDRLIDGYFDANLPTGEPVPTDPTGELPLYMQISGEPNRNGDYSTRCWGDGDCTGWLWLDIGSREYALKKAHEHVAEHHAPPTLPDGGAEWPPSSPTRCPATHRCCPSPTTSACPWPRVACTYSCGPGRSRPTTSGCFEATGRHANTANTAMLSMSWSGPDTFRVRRPAATDCPDIA